MGFSSRPPGLDRRELKGVDWERSVPEVDVVLLLIMGLLKFLKLDSSA